MESMICSVNFKQLFEEWYDHWELIDECAGPLQPVPLFKKMQST